MFQNSLLPKGFGCFEFFINVSDIQTQFDEVVLHEYTESWTEGYRWDEMFTKVFKFTVQSKQVFQEHFPLFAELQCTSKS